MLPVSLAMRPITVLSPVFTTTPTQAPEYIDLLGHSVVVEPSIISQPCKGNGQVSETNLQVRWRKRRQGSLSPRGYHWCTLVTLAVLQIPQSVSCYPPLWCVQTCYYTLSHCQIFNIPVMLAY